MDILKEVVPSEDVNSIKSNLKSVLCGYNKTYFLSGEDQMKIALYSSYLISMGYRTVLYPKELSNRTQHKFIKQCNIGELTIFVSEIDGNWLSGMFTSGSTGAPKLIVHTKEQIETTLSWYREIYGITENSAVITSMPATYNFTFIAGVLNCCSLGSAFAYIKAEKILDFLKKNIKKYDKIIVLANPVTLDIISEFYDQNIDYSGVFIDSGGSPLSSVAIRWFRDKGFIIREGYGLTETCSLNHFDIEGNDESIGTVGSELSGVRSELIHVDGRNILKLYSPNAGKCIDVNGFIIKDYLKGLLTTDIARMKDGRLTLLGRVPDYCINDYWPKDTLEIIADIIGPKCTLIQHISPESVDIMFWDELLMKEKEQVTEVICRALKIKKDNVKISANEAPLLHSLKLRRKNSKKR